RRTRPRLPARRAAGLRRPRLQPGAGRRARFDRAQWQRQVEPAQGDGRPHAARGGRARLGRRLCAAGPGGAPGAAPFHRPSRRGEARAQRRRDAGLLGRHARRPGGRAGARALRPRRAGRLALPPALGRAAPPPGAGAARRQPGAALAARRAADRPRQRRHHRLGRGDRRPSRRRRPRRLLDACAAAARRRRDPIAHRFRHKGCGMSAFRLLVLRDLRLALRQGGDAAMVVAFFVLTVILFPFGVGPEADLLARIAPGILWVTALLAALLSLERLFLADWEDGSLEALALMPLSLEAQVLAKCLAHWLVAGLPLIVVAPLLALLLHLDAAGYPVLVLSLLLGTPTLSLIGAVGAALSLGARRGGVLLSLLVLPLYIPVLIFGVAAVEAAIGGFGARPHLLLLGALLAGALVLAPLAAAAALRQALE